MPVFRVRVFVGLLAFALFTLTFMTFGVRWHVYRARAALYARQEMEHTFEAAHFARAGRSVGASDEDHDRAASYRKLAAMHEKAARECTRLRELYERLW